MCGELIAVIVIVALLIIWFMPYESFGSTSPGTLLQLVAQGPQDAYLVGGSRPYYYHEDLDYYMPFDSNMYPNWRSMY